MALRVHAAARGADGVTRMTLSGATFEGPPESIDLLSGAVVPVRADDGSGGVAYVLCADPDSDTLNLAVTLDSEL